MTFSEAYLLYISIHAPSRERQFSTDYYCYKRGISIHAPSRERPLAVLIILVVYHLFQSTLPHGSDRYVLAYFCIFRHFNPRSLTGATHCRNASAYCCGNFNPRSLTGATAGINFKQRSRCNFNPRSLTGATCLLVIIVCSRQISIHAPSRERRHTANTHALRHLLFQSTLPHGSDSIKTKYFYIHLNQVFIAN